MKVEYDVKNAENWPSTGSSNCPEPEDIHPCMCSTTSPDLYMNCSADISSERLNEIFQAAEFPVKEFYRFDIEGGNLTSLDVDFNGVSFEYFYIAGSPIETIVRH